jgi:hypothetical protein
VFEIGRPDGTMLEYAAFQQALGFPETSRGLGEILAFARRTRGSDTLEDDFSIVKLEL